MTEVNRTVVHVIAHSHLDREWYMGYESHRSRLLTLMDDLMHLFSHDPHYKAFHMDGQTIALDDYLEIHPEMRGTINTMVAEGKLSAGPWYILQDEFLVSGESTVRNLLIGMKEAAAFGKICPIGYFPDAFGNAGQMPQILKQAGMEAIVFGRGVRSVGMDNKLGSGGKYDSAFSELSWASPDGSALPAILFANWYSNGNEIPTAEDAARLFWDQRLQAAQSVAGTRHLLMMNGCDHQPVQADLTDALDTARRLYPDVTFIQTDFDSYVRSLLAELPDDITTIRGELTSQETDGFGTLVNTCSARVDLKQMNRLCENTLTYAAEPVSVLARLMGLTDDPAYLEYAWKKLMQNHPHDSICSCSVDQVNQGVKQRFTESLTAAEAIKDQQLRRIAMLLSREITPAEGHSFDYHDSSSVIERPFLVFSPDGSPRKELHTLTMDIHRAWSHLHEAYETLSALPLPSLRLMDDHGREIPAVFSDAGTSFGYELPSDRFRRPYVARQCTVTFEAELPGAGVRLYKLLVDKTSPLDSASTSGKMTNGSTGFITENKNCMITESPDGLLLKNDTLSVTIHADGSFDLTHNASGRCYPHLCIYEDCGDMGNEYIFAETADRLRILSQDHPADIEILHNNPLQACVRIRRTLSVPASADDTLLHEQQSLIWFTSRKAGRSTRMVDMTIETELSLSASAHALTIRITIHNQAKDHRVRLLLPTGIQTSWHEADSPFEVVRRPNRHSDRWKNPSGCEHMQYFVSLQDDKGGLMAVNHGLYEYEVLPDQNNTLALTLLRCVGEMGDWGYFPTPEAQMSGVWTSEVELIPFTPEKKNWAITAAYRAQKPLLSLPLPVGDCGTVPPTEKEEAVSQTPLLPGIIPASSKTDLSLLSYSGDFIVMTSLKPSMDAKGIVVRFVNVSDQPGTLRLPRLPWMDSVCSSNVIETCGDVLPWAEGCLVSELKPFEIATYRISPVSAV